MNVQKRLYSYCYISDGLVRAGWLTMKACRSVNNGERWNRDIRREYEIRIEHLEVFIVNTVTSITAKHLLECLEGLHQD